jgi:hypothetical protein
MSVNAYIPNEHCPLDAYDGANQIAMDDCALNAKEAQNLSINGYNLWNNYLYKCDNRKEDNFRECTVGNRNLWWRNGYGFTNGCYVDNDSMLRNDGKLTNDKHKTQLFKRFYTANPSLERGVFVPQIESRLIQGDDTSQWRQCDRLSEKNLDVFIPLIPCLKGNVQNPNNIIARTPRGGDNSRILMRSENVLQKCGYKHDGKTWRRPNSHQ